MIKGSPNLLIIGQGRVWGTPTMQFGGIWRYFSTSRLKIGRPKEGWTCLWLSPCCPPFYFLKLDLFVRLKDNQKFWGTTRNLVLVVCWTTYFYIKLLELIAIMF